MTDLSLINELNDLKVAFWAKQDQAHEILMDDTATDEERAIALGLYHAWKAAATDIHHRICEAMQRRAA